MLKKWRLFHAKDFHSLMYPCFTFCRILGMFPYKMNSLTFEISKLHYILSSVVICILCICNGIIIHDLFSKINLRTMNRTLESVCFFMVSCFITIITHILSGPRIRLLNIILKISLKLPSKSYQKLSKLIHIKDILCTIYFTVSTCIILPKVKFFCYLNGLVMVFTLYGVLSIIQINMLYVNCVYVLKACFKNINDNLAHMQKIMINDAKSCISMIGLMQRNQFLIIKLKTLKKWHLMVSDTMQMLNATFSLQILATMVMIFSDITFELYFYVVRWQNGIRIIFDKEYLYIFLIFIINHVILITLLVCACETSKNEAHEICITIHYLLNNTIDKGIKKELRLFSLQIRHCKNSFSWKGLTVDATLLTAMTGSITTYMLILIQFLITSHSCDGNFITNKI